MGKGSALGIFLAIILGIGGIGIGLYSLTKINQVSTQPLQTKIGASVYVNESYSESDYAIHTIHFDNESYDYNDDFDLTTDTFTTPESGNYLIIGTVTVSSFQDAEILWVTVYVNNVKKIESIAQSGDSGRLSATATDVLELNVNDTVVLKQMFEAGDFREIDGGKESTYLTIYKIDS